MEILTTSEMYPKIRSDNFLSVISIDEWGKPNNILIFNGAQRNRRDDHDYCQHFKNRFRGTKLSARQQKLATWVLFTFD